jgi:hypothetical protein
MADLAGHRYISMLAPMLMAMALSGTDRSMARR